jgi:hypothetical protein
VVRADVERQRAGFDELRVEVRHSALHRRHGSERAGRDTARFRHAGSRAADRLDPLSRLLAGPRGRDGYAKSRRQISVRPFPGSRHVRRLGCFGGTSIANEDTSDANGRHDHLSQRHPTPCGEAALVRAAARRPAAHVRTSTLGAWTSVGARTTIAETVIRYRFDQTMRDALLGIAWWDWSRDQLKAALPDFRNVGIEEFVAKYGQ